MWRIVEQSFKVCLLSTSTKTKKITQQGKIERKMLERNVHQSNLLNPETVKGCRNTKWHGRRKGQLLPRNASLVVTVIAKLIGSNVTVVTVGYIQYVWVKRRILVKLITVFVIHASNKISHSI
jgi:hypothetical protein